MRADEHHELSRENRIKAAYLYHFTRFIRWPGLPSEPLQPVTLCLDTGTASGPAFAAFITAMIDQSRAEQGRIEKGKVKQGPQEKSNQRTIIVKQADDIQQLEQCHLIYARQPGFNLGKHKGSLLVGDIAGPYRDQAIILFFTEQQRLRFQIHRERLQASGIFISSELLRLARITGDDSTEKLQEH